MSQPPSADSTTAFTTTTPRPWADFFDTSFLSLPVSFSDSTSRLSRNLTYFRVNYAILTSLILILTLILHPISLLILAAIIVSWYFLFFSRREVNVPLEAFGFTIDDRIVVAVLGVISFVGLLIANVWSNLLVGIGISAIVVCLHGVLRVPAFGDDDPYGGLLDSGAGAYAEF